MCSMPGPAHPEGSENPLGYSKCGNAPEDVPEGTADGEEGIPSLV